MATPARRRPRQPRARRHLSRARRLSRSRNPPQATTLQAAPAAAAPREQEVDHVLRVRIPVEARGHAVGSHGLVPADSGRGMGAGARAAEALGLPTDGTRARPAAPGATRARGGYQQEWPL